MEEKVVEAKSTTEVVNDQEKNIEEAIAETKKPLAGMDKEEAAKTMMESARVLNTARAIERSKNISDLKDIVQLLTHYNETKDKLHALPKEIAPAHVDEPDYIDLPVKEDVATPVLKHTQYAWGIAFVALAIAIFLVGKVGILSGFTYTPHLINIALGGFAITEVDIATVALLVVALVGYKVISSKNENAYAIECEEEQKADAKYNQAVEEVKNKNNVLTEQYEAAKEEAKKEADNANALTKMQRASFEATLSHLEADYMKHYAKMIPSNKLDIEYVKKLVKIIESEKALNIKDAVKIEAANNENQ